MTDMQAIKKLKLAKNKYVLCFLTLSAISLALSQVGCQGIVALPQAPSVNLSATPSTIHAGQTSTLTWQSTSVVAATIDGIGPVPVSGTINVQPGGTTKYRLTTHGPGGALTAETTIIVVPPPPAAELKASAAQIILGQSATL